MRRCEFIKLVVGAAVALCASLSRYAWAQEADEAKVKAGERVYNTYCQVCHGDALVSTGQVFDLRRLTAGDRARFENSVLNGKNQMPPWKGVVSDTEIDEVWHYIRANAYQK